MSTCQLSANRRRNGIIRTTALVVVLMSMWLAPLTPARSAAAQESPYAWIQQEMIDIRGLPLLHEVKERSSHARSSGLSSRTLRSPTTFARKRRAPSARWSLWD